MHTTIDYIILLRQTLNFDHVHQLHDFAGTPVDALADYIRSCLDRSSLR
jgi:hypothetical protein